MLRRKQVTATFFVPGHTARTFPETVRAIVDAGHEIACHNDVHESPVGLDKSQEAEILERAETALCNIAGYRPMGYRSPAFDLGPFTLELLEERGYLYDSSLMADDFTPYRPREGDEVDEQGGFHPGRAADVYVASADVTGTHHTVVVEGIEFVVRLELVPLVVSLRRLRGRRHATVVRRFRRTRRHARLCASHCSQCGDGDSHRISVWISSC